MSEWVDNNCEQCDTNNLVCLGNTSDETVPDVHGFKCYVCGHIQLFDLDAFIEEYANVEDGQAAPE